MGDDFSNLENKIDALVSTVHHVEIKLERVLANFEAEKSSTMRFHNETKLDIAQHREAIFGGESTTGLKGRVIHLEEKENNRKWQMRALWTATIAFLGDLLLKRLWSHP